jgi:mRNA-degrading endonuclease toxin of MazEF toxin-antitoxin module
MTTQHPGLRALTSLSLVIGSAMLLFSVAAAADPPSRVARMGYLSGAVSLSPAGENEWVQAAINRPLTTGDRVWTDAGARAEVQIGGALIRMNAGTGLAILNLDDGIAQLQLSQGSLNVRVRRLAPDQSVEIDTPNLALTFRQAGEFRIEVDADGNATTIIVRKGQGEVYGADAAYVVDARQPFRFAGTGLREYYYVDAPRADEFDRWSSERDRLYDNSASARYVSQDVVGYQDLDANGTWRVDASYGNVWIPNRVSAGWAPYRDGHWAWVDPWGWTWIDDAPWGFAVSHYGRWANMRGTWGWVPGPAGNRAYYAPALVAFVGGSNFQIAIGGGNVGGVAWFPLGPREVYRPSYPVSRGYFENVNRSNTVVSNTVINNYYNNVNVTNVTYANRQVPGAVVVVPTTTFVQSQPVARSVVALPQAVVASAPVSFTPVVAPTQQSVRGAAARGDQPPPRVFARPVVAHSAPPATRAAFAAQQPKLAEQPGRPLDDGARKSLPPAAVAPAVVNVLPRTQQAPPSMRPPAAAVRPSRDVSDERKAPTASAVPGAPARLGAPTSATPVDAGARPQEPRGQPVQSGQRPDDRAQPAPAPTAQPPVPRDATTAPQRGRDEQRGQAKDTPPAPESRAAEQGKAPQRDIAPVPAPQPRPGQPGANAPVKAAAPVPPAQPPAQRARPDTPPAPPAQSQRAQPATPPAPPMQSPSPQRAQPAAPPAPRTQSPAPQRAQPAAPPAPAMQSPAPQRAQPATPPAPPMQSPAPQRAQPAAPPAPAVQTPPPRGRPDAAPAAKQPEPATSAAPRAAPSSQPAPKAAPAGKEPPPGSDEAKGRKKDADDQKRDDVNRAPRG